MEFHQQKELITIHSFKSVAIISNSVSGTCSAIESFHTTIRWCYSFLQGKTYLHHFERVVQLYGSGCIALHSAAVSSYLCNHPICLSFSSCDLQDVQEEPSYFLRRHPWHTESTCIRTMASTYSIWY